MTSNTANQINAYIARTFPNHHGQCSVHGAGRGSVQVFSAGRLIVDIDTEFCAGRHAIALKDIGRYIRA